MNNEIDAMLEKANKIAITFMKEASDMDENLFLATLALIIKIYTIRNKVDIGALVSKLFIGIAQTEGDFLREFNKD